MSTADFPWQVRILDLFEAKSPEQLTRRLPYWKTGDVGLHAPDLNMGLRMQDYSGDGHPTRQEAYFNAGDSVGLLLQGKDDKSNKGSVITYADTLLSVGETIHFQVGKGGLLWNGTPFNERLNPTFIAPPGIAQAQDLFGFAKGVSGISTVDDVQGQIADLQATTGDHGITGDADFTSPFATFCTLTPQKIPLWNFGMIMFMQMLVKGLPLFQATAPGAPVILTPYLGAIVSKLALMDSTTAYKESVKGTVLGKELKSLMLDSIPGMNLLNFGG